MQTTIEIRDEDVPFLFALAAQKDLSAEELLTKIVLDYLREREGGDDRNECGEDKREWSASDRKIQAMLDEARSEGGPLLTLDEVMTKARKRLEQLRAGKFVDAA